MERFGKMMESLLEPLTVLGLITICLFVIFREEIPEASIPIITGITGTLGGILIGKKLGGTQ